MTPCPRTWFSTEFHTGKGLLRARLRDLYAPARAWGRAPLALVLFLTLAAGSLAACAQESPPAETTPEPVQTGTAEDGGLTVAFPLSDLEPYVPASTRTPDTVPADAMGAVLTEAELMDGQQVLCYWEPGSDTVKYWAVRQGDELLRFAVEESAYAGGYSVGEFSSLLGRNGFVITAPRGAAYTARDYYVFDEEGIPRLLADCAQPTYAPDLDGDGFPDPLWLYHGGREAYCYLAWEDALYRVDLLDCVQKALPDWRSPDGWETPTFSTQGLFCDAQGTGLAFLGEAEGVTRFGYLRFYPGRVEVTALPAETQPDWQAETGEGRAGLLTVGEQTWVLTEDGNGVHLAEVLHSLTEAALHPFTGILGTDGYALDYGQGPAGDYRSYYGADGAPLVLSFGWDRADTPVDLDGDGVRELVCGVTYMADGVPAVLVYRLVDGEIRQAEASALPEGVYQSSPPPDGPAWTTYDPETNTVTSSLRFPGEEDWRSWTAELALEDLDFYPYQYQYLP